MGAIVWIIIILILVIHENIEIRNYKRKHKKDAEEWCKKTNYRMKYHRDPPNDWDGKL